MNPVRWVRTVKGWVMNKTEGEEVEAVSCLSRDDEEKEKLPWLWADASCSASWWGVGPPVSGSPHLPLLCCGESDRWSPKVLVRSPHCFFRLSTSLLPWSDGTMPGEHGTLLALLTTRVNCLQRGVALPPLSPQNTLLPPCGYEAQQQVYFEVLAEWRYLCRRNMPSQGLRVMPALKWSRLGASCKLVFHWAIDRVRKRCQIECAVHNCVAVIVCTALEEMKRPLHESSFLFVSEHFLKLKH